MISFDRSTPGVLFDMDGTLVDSTTAVEAIWRKFADRYLLPFDDLMSEAHGVRAADTIARFLPATDVPAAVAYHERQELGFRGGSIAVPGAVRFFKQLIRDGVQVAIVTSASAQLAVFRLSAAGFDIPDVLVSAEDVAAGKPSPEGYLSAANKLKVDPSRCVVFEDAEAGILAGLASGAKVIVVGDHTSESTVGLDRIIDFRVLYDE